MAVVFFRGYLVNLVQISMTVKIGSFLFYYFVIGLIFYVTPRFFHILTRSDFNRAASFIWNTAVIIQPVMAVLPFIICNSPDEIINFLIWQYIHINNILFVLLAFYCCGISLYYYRSTPHGFLKQILKIIFISVAIFTPGFVFDIIYATSDSVSKEQHPFFFIRLFYLYWNIANIILLYYYFNRRIDISLSLPKIPDSFISEYLITTREKEIVELLLKSHTYNEIASKLFISPKTVERHISNIYRKTRSEKRSDLIQKIQGTV